MSPWRPLGPCRYPGCPNLQARDGNGYCEAHRAEGERVSRRGRYRGSAHARGYTQHYEDLRALLFAREPLCRLCRQEGRIQLAEHAHHIQPLSDGGLNALNNLMPLCREHHEQLHAQGGKAGFFKEEARRPAGQPTNAQAGLPESDLLNAGVHSNAQ